MAATGSLPVFLRVGEHPELHVGEVTFDLVNDRADVKTLRNAMAEFLRAAADAFEQPSEEGDDDAAPS
jgi:hypothetical protein